MSDQTQRPAPVGFGYSRFIGGPPELGPRRDGNLWFTADAIGMGMRRPKAAVIPLETVSSVELVAETAAKSKGGAVAVFGVLGLAAKGTKNITGVAVRTKDNQIAYYAIGDARVASVMVRAQITPILRYAGVPFYDEIQAVPATTSDIADQLRKLAALRDDGLLTEEEFAAQKAKLLG